MPPGHHTGVLRPRIWERDSLQRALWIAALLGAILIVDFFKGGRGPWVTAVLAVLLVVLGAAVGSEFSALARRLHRTLGRRSSDFGRLYDPRQIPFGLARNAEASQESTLAIRGVPGAYESAAAKLSDVLQLQCANPDRNRLTLVICDDDCAARILSNAFTTFHAFQCLIPKDGLGGREGVVRWLKTGSVELPSKLDVQKPTVVLLDNFAAYRDLGLEPADFARWKGRKFAALGWLGRPSEGAIWLDRFYPTASVVDATRPPLRRG